MELKIGDIIRYNNQSHFILKLEIISLNDNARLKVIFDNDKDEIMRHPVGFTFTIDKLDLFQYYHLDKEHIWNEEMKAIINE